MLLLFSTYSVVRFVIALILDGIVPFKKLDSKHLQSDLAKVSNGVHFSMNNNVERFDIGIHDLYIR